MDSLLIEVIRERGQSALVNLFRLQCIVVYVVCTDSLCGVYWQDIIWPRLSSQVSAMPARWWSCTAAFTTSSSWPGHSSTWATASRRSCPGHTVTTRGTPVSAGSQHHCRFSKRQRCFFLIFCVLLQKHASSLPTKTKQSTAASSRTPPLLSWSFGSECHVYFK